MLDGPGRTNPMRGPRPGLPAPGLPVSGGVRVLARMYAAGYDRLAARLDLRGAGDHRRRLGGGAEGVVLEVGVGTGRNLPLYRGVARVVALEPDPVMRARAGRAARSAKVPVTVVGGDAMRLPFRDASFDTVVCSLVLCTVADPRRALGEIRRVLRPGGMLSTSRTKYVA
ncbi:MAG: class I SAM-dependent methyltransferase [Actinomycetota bacterium]